MIHNILTINVYKYYNTRCVKRKLATSVIHCNTIKQHKKKISTRVLESPAIVEPLLLFKHHSVCYLFYSGNPIVTMADGSVNETDTYISFLYFRHYFNNKGV